MTTTRAKIRECDIGGHVTMTARQPGAVAADIQQQAKTVLDNVLQLYPGT